jgi:hypothetical protein
MVAYFDRPLVASLARLSLPSANPLAHALRKTFTICLQRNRRDREKDSGCSKDLALEHQTSAGA